MDKRFWAIIGVIIVIFGGIIIVNNNKKGATASVSSTKPTNHVRGDLASKVVMVEYGDYQCPVCEGYSPVVQQVEQKYNATVKFQFRNLPLVQIHQNTLAAARSSEAASNQGKFWEMHDALYDQNNWTAWTAATSPSPYFESYAKTLGLNMDRFKKDFASSQTNDRINADIDAFKKTGKEMSTPSFFINGKYYANTNFVDSTGAPTVDKFSKILDAALKTSDTAK